ncbi:hypothetical protein VNI00_015945 [Paramarasmius palmivorus]|uniref:Tropomyosin n=1 Tax=Paramarasmius palmivorus TaxID=297713 RepID=A0AAW0BFY8_9AGAR
MTIRTDMNIFQQGAMETSRNRKKKETPRDKKEKETPRNEKEKGMSELFEMQIELLNTRADVNAQRQFKLSALKRLEVAQEEANALRAELRALQDSVRLGNVTKSQDVHAEGPQERNASQKLEAAQEEVDELRRELKGLREHSDETAKRVEEERQTLLFALQVAENDNEVLRRAVAARDRYVDKTQGFINDYKASLDTLSHRLKESRKRRERLVEPKFTGTWPPPPSPWTYTSPPGKV